MIEQGNVFPARRRKDTFRRMANIRIRLLHPADTSGRLKKTGRIRGGAVFAYVWRMVFAPLKILWPMIKCKKIW